ncbi:group 1 truncated hemoglobin [Thalassotalea sp. 1_MG-2023]|uniref:group I truncated hemoglobin n=1 Tax=Thalassotalea sp. 1_MG-2023 TaxID=3062680 RepID=UPI0026E36334|nr:group 1 truncated hemoglobin [Thalassotalea sp. 1_MG-2023]MDO6425895.1 group 1 truncated hemoglobin [Thalassotalea sp. 1_MG-2023]
MIFFKRVMWLVLLNLSVLSCASQQSPQENNLYQALGEQQGISKLVDQLIVEIVADEQIFPYFAKASVSYFRKGFINHMCAISEGPCEYTGDSMVDIHTGMNISEGDFNRVVELLIRAMESTGISYPVQNRLLARLAPMREQIIKR